MLNSSDCAQQRMFKNFDFINDSLSKALTCNANAEASVNSVETLSITVLHVFPKTMLLSSPTKTASASANLMKNNNLS